jgi:tetratricopeptide (TPR) repeat protein
MESVRRILLPVGVLALYALTLPIRPMTVGGGSTTSECLTLTAHPPRGSALELRASYERCLTLAPDEVELMADLGGQFEAAGDRVRAEELYRRALTIDPGFAGVRLRLGEILLRRGDLEGARREATTALKSRPNSRAVLDLLQRAGGGLPGAAR